MSSVVPRGESSSSRSGVAVSGENRDPRLADHNYIAPEEGIEVQEILVEVVEFRQGIQANPVRK